MYQILEQQGPIAKIESADPKSDEIQADTVAFEAGRLTPSLIKSHCLIRKSTGVEA